MSHASTEEPEKSRVEIIDPNEHKHSHDSKHKDKRDSKDVQVEVKEKVSKTELADKLGDSHMNILPTKKIIIYLLTLGMIMIVSFADQNGVTVALTVIGKDLRAEESINWAGTASLLANCVSQVFFGRLSDIFGRKTVLLGGLLILAIADIGCGLCQTGVQFYICRAFAGIGNGCASSLGMVILSDIVSLKDRGRYQGILGTSVGIGNSIGPFIMAGFIRGLRWRNFYFFLGPFNIVVTTLTYFIIKPPQKKNDSILSKKDKFKKIDYLGILVATASLTLLLIPITGGGSTYPWNSTIVIAMFVVGGVLFFVFLLVEAKFATLPMVPLRIFKSPLVCLILLSNFFFGMLYFGFLYYAPYYYQMVKGKDMVGSSVLILPLVMSQALMSAVGGQIITFVGHYIHVVLIGFFLWLLGCCLLLVWSPTVSDGVIVVVLLIMGTGVGWTFQPTMVAVQAQSKKADRAVVISTRNVLRSFGGAVGISIGSATVSNSFLQKINSVYSNNKTHIPKSYLDYVKDNIYSQFSTSSLNLSQIKVIKNLYMDSLKNYFYCLIAFMAICFIGSLFIRDRGLQCIDEPPAKKKGEDLESSASSFK